MSDVTEETRAETERKTSETTGTEMNRARKNTTEKYA